jgi:spermidine/putrescine transport system substrate-binding protein
MMRQASKEGAFVSGENDHGACISRRMFQKTLAAAGLGLVIAPARPRLARAAGDLTYFTWSGYEEPALHASFVEKYGGSPDISFFSDEEDALQKLRAGFTPDIAHPCTYAVGRWRDAGVLEPIDVSRLDGWPELFDRLKTIPGTQSEGKQWFVPIEWGRNSILYRTDLVDIDPSAESWSILFDERYKGRLAMFDGVDQAVFAAAMVAGIDDPFNMSDAQLARVKEMLLEQKKLLRFYWTDQAEVEQALASGEIVAALAWNSSLLTLKGQGVPVRYMSPKEGNQTWVCGLVKIAGGTGSDEAAYDFMNAMLSPETGKFFIEEFAYAHSNRKSFEAASAERLAELELTSPEQLFENSVFLQEIEPATRQRYITMFEEVKATAVP